MTKVKKSEFDRTKYEKNHWDTFRVRTEKGKKKEIVKAAKSKDLSVNKYICNLIDEDLEKSKK